jgi:hypothetical protein
VTIGYIFQIKGFIVCLTTNARPLIFNASHFFVIHAFFGASDP